MSHSTFSPTWWCIAIPLITTAAACGLKPPAFLPQKPSLDPQAAEIPTINASFDPVAPDPSPPAHRDEKGKPQGPGGPVSADARDCGPAQNHCLRANGWFTDAFTDGEVSHPRVPVFEFEGRWYTWKGKPTGEGRVFRTKPATADTLSKAKEVYVFVEAQGDKATFDSSKTYGLFPASEKEALTVRRWESVRPYQINAAAGTFVDSQAAIYKIAACRVAFESRDVK